MDDDRCAVTCVHQDQVSHVRERMTRTSVLAELAEVFKLLGDPNRLRILEALSHQELCVCDLAALLGMSPSAVSHQLRLLRHHKLVKYRRQGKNAYYSLDDHHVLTLYRQGLQHISEC